MEARLEALEEKLAFLERHVEQLDEQLRELFDRLAAQQNALDRLREDTRASFDAIGTDGPDRSDADERPPHWGGAHT
jgi:uncharacterized coiled-coil protein SlyX